MEPNQKMIGITGASGYVGSHLLRSFDPERVGRRALVRRATHQMEASVEWHIGDIRNQAEVDRFVNGLDVLIHTAAFVHAGHKLSQDEIDTCFDVNQNGSITLIDAAAKLEKPPFFIFVSTTAVYGPSAEGATEETPCRPHSPYAESKLAAEAYLQEKIRNGEITGCILRPCMIYGRGGVGNLSKMRRLATYRVLPLIGDGNNQKSLLHIDNFVAAVHACLAAPERSNRHTFLIADETPLSMRKIASMLLNEKGWLLPLPKGSSLRMAGLADYFLQRVRPNLSVRNLITVYTQTNTYSTAKISTVLDFQPVIDTPDGLAQTLAEPAYYL